MIWFLLLNEEFRVWEQRIGAWQAECQTCRRPGWQLVFRIWRTKGSAMNPASPYGYAYNECYQVRCSLCGAGTMTGHPAQWVPSLGPAYTYENLPPVFGTPQYTSMAYAMMRL